MCTSKKCYTLVEFDSVLTSDSITSIGQATVYPPLAISSIMANGHSQFYVDKNLNGVDTLYAIKLVDAPLMITTTSWTTSLTGNPVAWVGPHPVHHPKFTDD